MPFLRQRWRFLAFALNSAVFYAAYVWASGNVLPTGGGETLWFGAAIAWWTLGLLSAPWYRPPRDAVGSSAAALLALVTLDRGSFVALKEPMEIAYSVACAYCLLVLVVASVAAATSFAGRYEALRRLTFSVGSLLARGEVLFGGPALISIFGFYTDGTKVFVLVVLWLGFALLKPMELILLVVQRVVPSFGGGGADPVGVIRRVDHPNILRVALTSAASWRQTCVALLPGGTSTYVIPLFTQIQDNELVGTGYCHGDAGADAAELGDLETGHIYSCPRNDITPRLLRELCGTADDVQVVGFVVEGSRIGALQFEAARYDELEEGSIVFCNLPTGCVYYQVLDANTAEESFRQNPRGTHIVQAVQLGSIDDNRGFIKYPWLPPMNMPVFRLRERLTQQNALAPNEFVIGEIPGTNVGLRVSLPDLIQYHCAVLGVTGTGKTELALDIVREALAQRTKVFCVDLTGEYRQRLSDLNPVPSGLTREEIASLEQKLFDAETGEFGAKGEKKALRTFLETVRENVRGRTKAFLEADDKQLTILELSEVTNTRATLRTTELFLSEIMSWARQHRKERSVLIVLEEAHTIIPETAGAGFDYDTQWVVGRIGQIALQGRKYGVGLMIVSQRTALVSKTILSQCNTYFTHSLIDQTSLGYLSNVYSAEHVRAIPNLRFLEFLASGKAVRSERPMLVRRKFDEAKAAASLALDQRRVRAGEPQPDAQPPGDSNNPEP